MNNYSGQLNESTRWLLERWIEKFSSVLESMTEDRFSLSWAVDTTEELGAGALIIEQRFSPAPDAILWTGLPEKLYQELGARVLSAVGIESSDVEENRATCLELLEQCAGQLASVLTERLSSSVQRGPSTPCALFPGGTTTVQVTISRADESLAPLWMAFHPGLTALLETRPVHHESQPHSAGLEQPLEEAISPFRKFDLLLDVALPVSVSFGKTELTVKDVLKLTTGSIVELNRSVSEPVDVIVNNCIIARGEVVVLEGNYGVRILNIVSRGERLVTGGVALTEPRMRVGAA